MAGVMSLPFRPPSWRLEGEQLVGRDRTGAIVAVYPYHPPVPLPADAFRALVDGLARALVAEIRA